MNLIADQLYSDVKSWPTDSAIIIDRIAGIEAPIPDTCREMLMYVTGGNMVHDRLGEAIALGKAGVPFAPNTLPKWQQIDQDRYELTKQYVVAEGKDAIGGNGKYTRFRKLVDWRGARILAEHDDLLSTSAPDANVRLYDGLFVDNFDTNPNRSFRVATEDGKFTSVNVGEHYAALAEYLRLALRRCWVNMPIPHAFHFANGEPDTGSRIRAVAWVRSLGVRGIYYETSKYAAMKTTEEQESLKVALANAVDSGLGVALGFFDPANAAHQQLWDIVSARGREFDVYRSR